VLLARADDEGTPRGYCDDLFDYWPDAQHPVGYHPSTACSADASRTRGFDAWMSRNASGHALLDPVRMRNMMLVSQVFGAAHLVCDAHAYAAPGHCLNPYYMQSRWDEQAHADPAMPAAAEAKTVDEMPTLGAPFYADADTTLRGQAHSADSIMQHSVGLVRVWVQWFPLPNASTEDTAAAQTLLDERWPHWLPAKDVRGEAAEHGGLFLGDAAGDANPPPGCRFPRLLRCRVDSECNSSAFRCLLNVNEEANTRRGVCMPAGSCYQHAHCASDKVCSGEGACVEPQLLVRNLADWDSDVQLFGKEGCDVSTRRLSVSRASLILRAPTACAPSATGTSTRTRRRTRLHSTSSSPCPTVSCCARTAATRSASSPYPDGTLLSAARDIKRCSKLGLCPSTRFYVRGRAVEARRVRVHVLSEDSPNSVASTNDARDYCGLDAQRCWGMGHLLGRDCAELDQERNALCVVDALVLPLLAVVYPREPLAADFGSRLLELRRDCPCAFTQVVNCMQDTVLFKDVHALLTQPYAWTDSVLRQRVLEHANSLFFMLFGVAGGDRGFASVDGYLAHAQCATFVERQLREQEDAFARQEADFAISFYNRGCAGCVDNTASVLPGVLLYLIDRRLPVSVNLRWLLQCVVLAKDKSEGVAMGSFFTELNSGRLSARYDTVECANYGHDATDATRLPLSNWLHRAKFLFTQQAQDELHPLQITQDVFTSISCAVAQLPVYAMPDLVCVTAKDGSMRSHRRPCLLGRQGLAGGTAR
jgi:hypothetical protein